MAIQIKVKITATDNIGRSESITLMLDEKTAESLRKADALTDSVGQPCSELAFELAMLYDAYKMPGDPKYDGCLSRSQFYRLRDFYATVHNKFYKYKLTIN